MVSRKIRELSIDLGLSKEKIEKIVDFIGSKTKEDNIGVPQVAKIVGVSNQEAFACLRQMKELEELSCIYGVGCDNPEHEDLVWLNSLSELNQFSLTHIHCTCGGRYLYKEDIFFGFKRTHSGNLNVL